MEFTRKTRKRGHKTHGTQCIDKKWSGLKRYIPKELCSKTPNRLLNEKIAEYVYSFVWQSNTLGKHQLKDLGKLAHKTWTAWGVLHVACLHACYETFQFFCV